MKPGLIIFGSTATGVGLFAVDVAIDKAFEFTIADALKEQNRKILNFEGEDESWLVLAQKYREHGTTRRYSERNFKNQKNPGFLEDSVWEKYKGNYEEKENDFSKDEELAEELKKACLNSLTTKYEEKLYDQVLKWCHINLSTHTKSILKIQRKNGNCRFWLIKSERHRTGWFIWEVFEDKRERDLISLEAELTSDSGQEILKHCAINSYDYLELSFHPTQGQTGNSWKINDSWKSDYKHKLPIKQ